MRARAVGGYEPDDDDQAELSRYFLLARTALSGMKNADGRSIDNRTNRINYAVDEFIKAHAHAAPAIARKWVYVWAVDNLGLSSADLTHAKNRRSLVGEIKPTMLYRRVLVSATKHADGIAGSGNPRAYTSLKKAGYLETVGIRDGKPVYRITDAGKEALAAWQQAQQVAPSVPR